jgi:GAF domain-containing protein
MAYSKSEVDRAGRALVELLEADRQTIFKRAMEFHEAVLTVNWWRGEHAKPLSRVAANLRHYAGKEGRPIVAQAIARDPALLERYWELDDQVDTLIQRAIDESG